MLIGTSALQQNDTGNGNIGLGRLALTATRRELTMLAIGYTSLYSATGSNNIALGYQSGDNITTGSNNMIGYSIDAQSATQTGDANYL
ncbi:MAG: hypothetical protein R3B12_01120 [Candidatus Saccharimonadales bacterium]